MEEINKGTRIVNFTVDLIIIVLIYQIIVIIRGHNNPNVIFYSIYILYYFSCEVLMAQTIGKKLTNTVVVGMNNEKPGVLRILFRTILRLNPFDSYSYLFGQEQGAHDLISKTRLINKN